MKHGFTISKKHHTKFHTLLEFLAKVPAVSTNDTPWGGFGTGEDDDIWWVKFSIDIEHRLSWHTVQEFASVLNYLSLEERLPAIFKPVSPPPYLNGGPVDYLSWVLECDKAMQPETVFQLMEGRLPNPVDDLAEWSLD